MRIFLLFVMLFLQFSCQQLTEKPKNLISKNQMSEIVADLALNDQAMNFNNEANIEAGTRFILQKHQVSAQDFTDSYKYYIVKRQMESILNDSQKLLLDRHPESRKVIEAAKKANENTQLNL